MIARRTITFALVWTGLLLCANARAAEPHGTTFTYQGHLKDNGSPANGDYDFEFELYDGDGAEATPVTTRIILLNVPVMDGLFTVELDFGDHFNGDERWLQIGVRPGGSGGPFTELTGRQPMTATPYSLRAKNAALADTVTTVPWSAISDVPDEILATPWEFAGPIHAWGSNNSTLLNEPTGYFVDIAAGGDHALALTSSGGVIGWGSNLHGQLNIPPGVYHAISAGGSHSLVIRQDGRVFGYGDNSAGQIDTPIGGFQAISAGELHSLGIRLNGTLFGWGWNAEGQTDTPSGTFTAVAAGFFHSLAIRTDGTLAAWGNNAHGQTDVPSGTFVSIAAGSLHSLALSSNGTLVAWGNNDWGQCNVPSGTFTHIAAGNFHNLAIRSNGTLVAWGRNDRGQTNVPAGSYSRVACSSENSMAIRTHYVAPFPAAAGDFVVQGNLGVGTAMPSSRLSVNGNVDISGTRLHVSTSGKVGVGATTSNELFTVQAGMLLDAANQASGAPETGQEFRGLRMGGLNSGEGISSNRTGGSPNMSGLDFYTARAARMSITNSGNVGIGTQSPSQRLHVVGNICATGTIGVCSDARFKEHVEPVSGALEKVDRLRGVAFDWKREAFPDHQFAEDRQLGFIAQEVEKVLPQVVSRGADGYLSVDYGRLTPVLVEALRELRAEKDRELAEKDDRIAELTRRLNKIETILDQMTADKQGANR